MKKFQFALIFEICKQSEHNIHQTQFISSKQIGKRSRVTKDAYSVLLKSPSDV